MTGSSHAYVGVALAAACVPSVTPAVLAAVALGSLAPDFDHKLELVGGIVLSSAVARSR